MIYNEKMYFYDISIQTNFHQNRFINECARMIFCKVVLPGMTFEVILYFMKKMCLYNVDILEKFLSDSALNKIYIAEKDNFEI